MKLQKTLFLTRVGSMSQDAILRHANLPYTKIVLLYGGVKDLTQYKIPRKVEIYHYANLIEMKRFIKQAYQKYYEYRMIPYFVGDMYSKYALYAYNLSFNNKIDARIFKEKDMMMDFLGELGAKKNKKLSYSELHKSTFYELQALLGPTFILKPTNASSSTYTFKIKSQEEYAEILTKISKSYDYLVEEYIGGNLFSLDFYMDGENLYMLCFAREVAMIDLIETKKFSKDFLEKYGEDLEKHFNFVLPIRYNVDFTKISKIEISFFEKLRKRLSEVAYRGFVHLEYKYDIKTQALGFIEWGARPGGNRPIYVKELYHTDMKKIPYYLLIEKDTSRFKALKPHMFAFKEKEDNINLVGVKTNFIKPTHYIDILSKTGDVLDISFQQFILDYFKNTFGIRVQDIRFQVKDNKHKAFLPFYMSNKTKFDYILELDDENFAMFKKKKPQIIEKVFFHNYK